MISGSSVSDKGQVVAETAVSESDKNDYYTLLDEFTETDDDEVKRIDHTRILNRPHGTDKYRCNKCRKGATYFCEAERHFMVHSHEDFASVRKELARIDTERANDAKERRHAIFILFLLVR